MFIFLPIYIYKTFIYIFPQIRTFYLQNCSGTAIEIVKKCIFVIDYKFTLGDLFLHFQKVGVLSFKMQ